MMETLDVVCSYLGQADRESNESIIPAISFCAISSDPSWRSFKFIISIGTSLRILPGKSLHVQTAKDAQIKKDFGLS